MPVKVAIVGATGYAGGELARLLLRHPEVLLVAAVARTRQGEPLRDVQPHLHAAPPTLTVGANVGDAEVVFTALPAGEAAKLAPAWLKEGRSVIDIGSDFRLHDPADYQRWYGYAHPAPELLPEVPNLEALARLFEKRTEIETLLRRAILLYLGVQHNWNNTKLAKAMQKGIHSRKERGATPEDLFVGRTPQQVVSDLYTLDLKTIITSNWDTFGPLFGGNRGRFEMNMDTLNKARRIDAHAKPIPPAESEEISNSYAWLRARLDAIPNL